MTLDPLAMAEVFFGSAGKSPEKLTGPGTSLLYVYMTAPILWFVSAPKLSSGLFQWAGELKSEVPSIMVTTGGALWTHFSHHVTFPPGDMKGRNTHEILVWAEGRGQAQGHGQGESLLRWQYFWAVAKTQKTQERQELGHIGALVPETCFPQTTSRRGGRGETEVPPNAGRSTSLFRPSVATILVLPHLETGWIPAFTHLTIEPHPSAGHSVP